MTVVPVSQLYSLKICDNLYQLSSVMHVTETENYITKK